MNNKDHKHNIRETVLERITREGVTQTARWVFVCKNGFLWGLWGASVLVGALGAAAIVFSAEHAGWEFYEATHENVWTFLVEMLPYLWIVVLLITALVSHQNLRHTKKGYRYPLSTMIVCSVGASTVLGLVLYALGAGAFVERTVGAHIPFHKPATSIQRDLWLNPDAGRLIGTIDEIQDGAMVVTDHEGNEWSVNTETLRGPSVELLQGGTEVRVLGYRESEGDYTYYACAVLPGPMPDRKSGAPKGMFDRRKDFLKHMEFIGARERNVSDERINRCGDVRSHTPLSKPPTHVPSTITR